MRAGLRGCLVVTLAVSLAVPLAAQSQDGVRRTADGKPDLSGVWQAVNTAAWDIQDHSGRTGRARGQGRRRGQRDPVPAVGAGEEAGELREPREGRPGSQVLSPRRAARHLYAVPVSDSAGPADDVTILYEYTHTARHIYMNGTDHPRGPIEWWMGDSRGRWDGDTLVVDVVHFTDQTWFDRAGNFHSEALHVVERYTPMGRDHIRLRGHDRGSQGVHAAVEDEHGAVSPPGAADAAPGLRVLQLCLRREGPVPESRAAGGRALNHLRFRGVRFDHWHWRFEI